MRIKNWDEYEYIHQMLLDEWSDCNDELYSEKKMHSNVERVDWYFLGVEELCLKALPMIRAVRKLTDAARASNSAPCQTHTEPLDTLAYDFLNQYILWTGSSDYYSDEICRNLGRNIHKFLSAFQEFLESEKTRQPLTITETAIPRNTLSVSLKSGIIPRNTQADAAFTQIWEEEETLWQEWNILDKELLTVPDSITMSEWRRLLLFIEKMRMLSFISTARTCFTNLADLPDCSIDILYEAACLWKELLSTADDFIRFCECPPKETGHFQNPECQALELKTYRYLKNYEKLLNSILEN